jgi:hypothetical protein
MAKKVCSKCDRVEEKAKCIDCGKDFYPREIYHSNPDASLGEKELEYTDKCDSCLHSAVPQGALEVVAMYCEGLLTWADFETKFKANFKKF